MKKNLKKMLTYYKPYRKIFLADTFFAFLGALVALIIPLLVRYVTSTVIYEPMEEAFVQIAKIAVILIVLVAIQYYSNYFIGNYGHIMGAQMEYDMRREIFDHYQKLSFSFYDEQKVGKLMSRITSDLFDISELMHHGPENLIICSIRIVGSLLILLTISPFLTAAAFLLILPMIAFAFVYNKKMNRAFRTNRERIAEINGRIEDNLSGIRVVKSFANEDVEREKFREGNDAFLASKKKSYSYMGGYNAGITAFITLITVSVLLCGSFGILRGFVDISDLITFFLYVSVFTEPVKTLIAFTEQFQSGYKGFCRFAEILDIDPDIFDPPGALSLENVKGDIAFEKVSFHYANQEESVLHEISLQVPAGSYLALVGSSGVGKTTLCSLIPRFYEVSGGSVTLDGIDIRNLTLKSLRSHIGIVQQDVYLFAGTVLENIAYGKPGSGREEIIAAAKAANAHDFIMGLPNGYDTDIGQRGVKLSGGQKQRLSIARVFLKNPEILIFDEATSALDNESERVVQESLERLAKGRTTFVIAHRLSTIRNAQQILALTEEGIKEQGTHEELMQKEGVYHALYTAK